MKLLEGLQTGTAKTHNGATTHQSTLNKCLDFFFIAGSARDMTYKELSGMFTLAYNEDKATALKILFWLRDVRGGAGERKTFRILLQFLCKELPDIYQDIIEYIPVYGRWDDLFFNENVANHSMQYLKEVIESKDGLDNNLLFKWLPREKSTNKKIASFIRQRLEMSPKSYRHMLAENSITVENQLCDKQWDKIKYKSVPSKAFSIYSEAFKRHDEERFNSFLQSVEDGKETINAGAIFPVDIYKQWENNRDTKAINAQWSQLPDYMNDENVMAVCDTSGSMNGQPMSVSVSLGVYISERSKGKFKDHFITFEGNPRLQSLSGTATNRFSQVRNAGSDMSTNLQRVFELLLEIANRDNLSDSDMPDKLLIISDMEFNEVAEGSSWFSNQIPTNFDYINNLYKQSGYTRPNLVFWNVNGRMDNYPVQEKDNNTALVSGYSPSILQSVLSGKDLSPTSVMLEALEKYNFIDKL